MEEKIKEKIHNIITTLISMLPIIAIGLLLCFGKWKAALYVLSCTLFLIWLSMYAIYKLSIFQSVILFSAGKMETGNDLGKQVENTLKKEKIPNFFRFYWMICKKIRGLK